jgi:hypothetical protein
MPANGDTEYRKKIDDLTAYFQNAKDDPQLLKKVGEDPLGVLQSMDICVEDEFTEAVKSQLQALAATTSLIAHKREVNQMSAKMQDLADSAPVADQRVPTAPTGLRVVSVKKSDTIPPEVKNAVQFLVKPWGLVLVVREPAIKYLEGGGDISAGTLGGIAAVAALTSLAEGPLAALGILVGVILGICAAALAIYAGVIKMMNQGKGIYLTWTWAQFIPWLLPPLVPNPVYGIPVVTPIK